MKRLSLALQIAAVLVALGPQPSSHAREVSDPIEPLNRAIFWFNDQLDLHALEPAARGWDLVLNDRIKVAIACFFDNVRFPVVMINNLLQGKFLAAASDTARFAVNSTLGVAGFFDPASDFGLQRHDEDFGQTLGYWGVPPGPYLVAPLLGPTNVRDAFGRIVDTATALYPLFAAAQYTAGATVTDNLNFRAQVLDQVRDAKAAALDYYVFVRDAYDQRRRSLIRDTAELSEERAEDLYFEDGEDEQAE